MHFRLNFFHRQYLNANIYCVADRECYMPNKQAQAAILQTAEIA